MTNSIKKHRSSAYSNQSGKCYYCHYPMWLSNPKGFAQKHNITLAEAKRFQCTAEHLKARSDGGSNSKENIVAACMFCNFQRHNRKKALNPRDFKGHVQKRLEKRKWHSQDRFRFVSASI